MPALNVLVEPERAPALDLDEILALFATAAELADAELSLEPDEEDGTYVNYRFRANDLARLWEVLQAQVFANDVVGPQLAHAAIATCEGARGSDDYLLLHHYDRTLGLDELPRR